MGAPPAELATRHVLVGYGHRQKKMPPSSLALYKRMEEDYAVGMCLAILSAPIIAGEWSIEVKEAGKTQPQRTQRSAEVDQTQRDSASSAVDSAESIQEKLTDMITPIWRDTVKHLLTALSRKAAPCEKRFEMRDGKLWLKKLDPVCLDDAELLVIEQKVGGQVKRQFGGMAVKVKDAQLTREEQRELYGVAGVESASSPPGGSKTPPQAPVLDALAPDQVPVPPWKTFWFAFDATDGELVGKAIRMERAKRPWWQKASEGGLYDIEDIWFRQRVADPVTVYYREGTRRDGRNNEDVAFEIGQTLQANSVAAIPLGDGQTPDNSDFVVKTPEGQKESKQIPDQIDQSVDPRIMLAFCIAPLIGGAKQEIGAYSLGQVLERLLLWQIEDIGDQVTQWLSKYLLQPLVNWNWGDRWSVTLKLASLAPEVVAMLRDLVKQLFAGSNGGKLLAITDLAAILKSVGITLADDAADQIEQLKKDLASGGAGLAEQFANALAARSESNPTHERGLKSPENSQNGDGMPPAVEARLKRSALDDRTDEAATAADSFWAALREDLKKKRPEPVSMRN